MATLDMSGIMPRKEIPLFCRPGLVLLDFILDPECAKTAASTVAFLMVFVMTDMENVSGAARLEGSEDTSIRNTRANPRAGA